MKVYQIAGCPFAHRARIVLEEKKLGYELIYFEAHHRPAVLEEVSPDAKSPTIFDETEGVWVWESLVVIEYLDERYPDVALMPRAAAERARVRLFMRNIDQKLLPAMERIEELKHASSERDEKDKLRTAVTAFHGLLVPWEARLTAQPFLLGDQLTLADIVLFTPIAALERLLGEEGAIPEALSLLRAWHDRIAVRPSTAYLSV